MFSSTVTGKMNWLRGVGVLVDEGWEGNAATPVRCSDPRPAYLRGVLLGGSGLGRGGSLFGGFGRGGIVLSGGCGSSGLLRGGGLLGGRSRGVHGLLCLLSRLVRQLLLKANIVRDHTAYHGRNQLRGALPMGSRVGAAAEMVAAVGGGETKGAAVLGCQVHTDGGAVPRIRSCNS